MHSNLMIQVLKEHFSGFLKDVFHKLTSIVHDEFFSDMGGDLWKLP
jgi:hypothetical protein